MRSSGMGAGGGYAEGAAYAGGGGKLVGECEAPTGWLDLLR